jgi:hypothetical protein
MQLLRLKAQKVSLLAENILIMTNLMYKFISLIINKI